MRKKLYKAKKTWIIGMAASAVILMGGLSSAKADANTPQSTNMVQTTTNTVSPSNKNNGTLTTNTDDSHENQGNITNSSQQATTPENIIASINNDHPDPRYPNKATATRTDSYSDNFNDVNPKNSFVLTDNPSGQINTDDDDDEKALFLKAHYTKQMSAHQMLMSKSIQRRGQNYTVGLASDTGSNPLVTYISDGKGEAIGDGSGIVKGLYLYTSFERALYWGTTYFEWNNNTAITFKTNGYRFGKFPDEALQTIISAHMLNNGVLNYNVIWHRNTKEPLTYTREYNELEQPFSFGVGDLINKHPASAIDVQDDSPIVKLNDDLYFNCIQFAKENSAGIYEAKDYILQFIKIDPANKVMSASDNYDYDSEYWPYHYDQLVDPTNIPGVAPFVSKNSKTYVDGINIYSPVDDKGIVGDHDKLAVMAFGKDQPNRTIKFQRVFLNAQELSGLASNQIVPYVYGLFAGKSGEQLMESLPAGEPLNTNHLTDAWDKDNQGHKFYFGPDGHAVKGWQKFNGNWYYFNPNNGWADTGWQKIYGNWYYFNPSTGAALTNWQKINSSWYYFDPANAWAADRLQKINGSTYYFKDHKMVTNQTLKLAAANGLPAGTYHFDKDGYGKLLVNSWQKNNTGKWMYQQDGNFVTGWQRINGSWYYFDNNTKQADTGWQKINNQWYYFDPTSANAWVNWQTINGNLYYFDPNNAYALTGWQQFNNDYYYFDPANAWAADGLQKINGSTYYFKDHKMVTNQALKLTAANGLPAGTYHFDKDGYGKLLVNGWQKDNAGKWMYQQDGNLVTGWQKINGSWYYFDNNTKQADTGWQKINNQWYYFDPTSANAWVNWQTINGNLYYFDPNNAYALTGWQQFNNDYYYFDPANAWAADGLQKINGSTYYFKDHKMVTNQTLKLTGANGLPAGTYYFDKDGYGKLLVTYYDKKIE